jgi:hypothetical protein
VSKNAEVLKNMIEAELSLVHDLRVTSHIRGILIEPLPLMRNWDYGTPGQQYLCWMVLKDPQTGAEIGYCEEGFGPSCPWGLVSSGDNDSMGQDSGWSTSFMDAYFESFACTTLPIWRVLERDASGETPVTAEGDWDAAWAKAKRFEENNPSKFYYAGHTISYGRPTDF